MPFADYSDEICEALVILVTFNDDPNKLSITSRASLHSVENRKLATAVYISTIILLGSMCASSCAVFAYDEPAPTTEVSRTTTTTQTNVPDATTQRTTVTQTNGY